MAMEKKYGNKETQRLYERNEKSKGSAMGLKPKMEGSEMGASEDGAQSEHDHEGQDGDHSVIDQIVAEHGPATSHEHTSEGEDHKVVSHHEDGHTHMSKGHPHFGHAHEHMGHAHGEPSTSKKSTMPDDEEMEAGTANEGSIPTLGA